jgi:DNA-binding PadR family transcriptional regulator
MNEDDETVDEAIDRLIELGLIKETVYESGEKYYSLTELGKQVIEQYQED